MTFLKHSLLLLLFVSMQQCAAPPPSGEFNYLYKLDEILNDPNVDGDFRLCNTDPDIYEYFNDSKGMKFKGENKAINDHFAIGYQPPSNSKESGLVRIRFVVNCKGESGRFRLMAMDENYKAIVFDTKITDQLMELTQSLKGWGIMTEREQLRDYYQYLIFKIENGTITKILP